MNDFIMRWVGNISTITKLPSPFADVALSYIDIGARGGPPQHWLKLARQMTYLCFEPDPTEAELLRTTFSGNSQFQAIVSPCALGAASGTATLHLTHSRPCSSLLKPNAALLDMFAHGGLFEVEKELPIPIVTLDSELKRLGSVGDFIKADVQGYELEVLRGGTETLSAAIGCELEVSFIELYKNQPLFAEIDQWMRSKGFFLADLERVWWRRAAAPVEIQQRGSLIYGDAIYLKNDIISPLDRTVAIKSTMICIAAGLHELAYEVVLQAHKNRLLSLEEAESFHAWLHRHQRSTTFWYHLSKALAGLPGRQTLGRLLSLWGRAFQGNSDSGSDAASWNRRTSW
jgi:protein O-GlcNAc transferase